jgi:hypothetical protein
MSGYEIGLGIRLKGENMLLEIGLSAILIIADLSMAQAGLSEKPIIKKLGTIDCDMVETTPVVFHDKLYRFEYVRNNYQPNKTSDSYFRFVDVKTGKAMPSFAKGYHLGSAHIEDDTAYVYGVNIWDGDRIQVFWSKDLENWSDKPALVLKDWGIFNTSVCKGMDGKFIMAFEIGRPPEETGVAFTNRFAESDDLINWKLTPSECVYSKERYTACPAIRFFVPYYYMIYLEARPGPTYEPHIVRSKNLIDWQSSQFNPMMQFSDEDKIIKNTSLSPELQKRIKNAENLNNSDVDLCEFNGKVIIYYSWGNQQGIEHLAEAIYDGTLEDFLNAYFPK